MTKLVTYRERLEKLQERELGLAAQRQAERQRALDRSRDARGELMEYTPEPGPIDPTVLAAATVYLGRVDREIEARSAALANSAAEVNVERDKLLIRRRDRKAMEVLRGRALERVRAEKQRTEAAAIDEQATTRWARTR
jgi:flagellar export protein FliJ